VEPSKPAADQSGKISPEPTDVLSSLIGEWRGGGVVSLPATAPLDYAEDVVFARRSEASLDYRQRAVDRSDGSMLHSESGIWHLAGAGRMVISIALPGATELSEGTLTGRGIDLRSTAVSRVAAGPHLVATHRRYELGIDSIRYEIAIATDRSPSFAHLRGELHRVGDGPSHRAVGR